MAINFIDAYMGDMSVNEFFLNHGAKGLNEYLVYKRQGISSASELNTDDPMNISWEGTYGSVSILGGIDISTNSRLEVDLFYSPHGEINRKRIRVDLLNYDQLNSKAEDLSRRLLFDKSKILEDLDVLRDELHDYRDELYAGQFIDKTDRITENEGKNRNESVEFLKQPDLLKLVDKRIETSGLVGEEKSRTLCFLVALSHKTNYPLHGIVKGSSGSGKSQLVNHMMSLMPPESIIDYTSGSNQTMSYDRELENKFVVVQDFDGFTQKTQYDFRELQSNLTITRSVVDTNEHGERYTKRVTVRGGFSSLGASTKNIYHDNETRSILITVDESTDQTLAIQKRQNQLRAGLIDIEKEEQSKILLRNCVRNLKDHNVINPFAMKVTLPLLPGLRRLNNQFHDLISVITILNQYKRDVDLNGNLIATHEDVEAAIEIFFESIIIKVDDLDALTRTFYDKLIQYINSTPKGSQTIFKIPEIRKALEMKNGTVNIRIKTLLNMGYVQIVGGKKNIGYEYQLNMSDGIARKREEIKENLTEQLLKTNENK